MGCGRVGAGADTCCQQNLSSPHPQPLRCQYFSFGGPGREEEEDWSTQNLVALGCSRLVGGWEGQGWYSSWGPDVGDPLAVLKGISQPLPVVIWYRLSALEVFPYL